MSSAVRHRCYGIPTTIVVITGKASVWSVLQDNINASFQLSYDTYVLS